MGTISAAGGLCALATAVALAGCSATATETGAGQSASQTSASAAADQDGSNGPNMTIADYVTEKKIDEAPVERGEPGTPTFDFPIPPDWRGAGAQKPEWAYGAIVYEKAADPDDPPFVTAIVTKLTGDVEAARVLEYAPGMLRNLPGYQPTARSTRSP